MLAANVVAPPGPGAAIPVPFPPWEAAVVRTLVRLMPVLALCCLGATEVVPVGTVAAVAVQPRAASVLRDPSLVDTLVTGATSAPVAVTSLPDGAAVVLEKGGAVRVIRNGVLVATPALTLDLGGCTNSERGLLGFAVDPDYLANGYVYLHFTRASGGGCVNRVSRFVMRGNTIDPASQTVLLDNIVSACGNHDGGDVFVANDGYLYVTVGDSGCDPRGDSGGAGANDAARDLSILNGKILRVDRATGAPAPGNPFSGAGTAACRTAGLSTPTNVRCREIYAYGLRNPWRFAFDPNTSGTRFFINDVGQNTREEVDLGVLGADYGWNIREGVCQQGANPPCTANPAQFRAPITDYPHSIGTYITGGAFVPNGAWGKVFDGAYLFADGNPGRIYARNAAGQVNYSTPLATGIDGISDMDFVMEPSGWSLYYVNPQTNEVRRISRRAVAPPAAGNLHYVPAAPRRVLDTGAGGALRAGTSRLVRLTTTPGAHRMAMVNITLVGPSTGAFVSMWHPHTTRPGAWTAFGAAGATSATAAIVPVDPDGNVLLYTSATTRVIVDVMGFFDTSTGGVSRAGRFGALTPSRLVDTASPAAAGNAYTRTGGTVNVPVEGRAGVPTTASAVALHVTLVAGGPGANGNVIAHAHGTAVPGVSHLSVGAAGDVRTNLVVVPVGADGSVDLELFGSAAHAVVDVVGWFTDGSAASSARGTFVALAATRIVDSRSARGFARLAAGGTGTVNPTVVPDTAVAVSQQVMMWDPAAAGRLVAYPTGVPVPDARMVTATTARVSRSGSSLSRLGAGRVSYRSTVATDVVADATGYFRG